MEEKNFNFCVCRGEVYIIAKHLQVVFVEEKHTHTHTKTTTSKCFGEHWREKP